MCNKGLQIVLFAYYIPDEVKPGVVDKLVQSIDKQRNQQ